MVEPCLARVAAADGVLWCVTYAGMKRCHRQEWQAQWLYDAAMAAYGAEHKRLGGGEALAA